MGLIFLVDHSCSCLESLPDALAELLCNRAVLLPLLVQLLELAECLNHILLLSKRLCLLTKLFLGLKILLEVKITKFAIDLYHIIELLHIELICLCKVSIALCRYRTDGSPTGLDLTECRECRIYILLLLKKCLKVSNHSLFLSEIVLPLLIEGLIILCTFLLIFIILLLEACFDNGERTVVSNLRHLLYLFALYNLWSRIACISLLLLEPLVERSLERLCLLGHLHPFLVLHELLKKRNKLCQCLFRIVYCRFCDFSSLGHQYI